MTTSRVHSSCGWVPRRWQDDSGEKFRWYKHENVRIRISLRSSIHSPKWYSRLRASLYHWPWAATFPMQFAPNAKIRHSSITFSCCGEFPCKTSRKACCSSASLVKYRRWLRCSMKPSRYGFAAFKSRRSSSRFLLFASFSKLMLPGTVFDPWDRDQIAWCTSSISLSRELATLLLMSIESIKNPSSEFTPWGALRIRLWWVTED